jgi:NodT family efflux transporter outer membrane factor (OMF) lipoprotein
MKREPELLFFVVLRVLRVFVVHLFSLAFRRAATVFVATALIAGCAAPVTLPTLHGSVPDDWRSIGAADARLGPAPDLQSWWKAFADPRLDALIERALAQNLTLAQARLRVQGARALQHRADMQYRPQVSFHTFAQPDPTGSTSYFEIGFDALWEFGFFGRREADARIAAADAQGAQADAAAARVSVVAEVARNYVELRAAQARGAPLQAIVAQRREQARIAARRAELRLGTSADATRAQAELAQAQADLGEPEAAAVQAQSALAVLLGEATPDAALLEGAAQPQLGALAIAAAPADLLRTRPEIRKAELNVLKAAGELGLARADLYPKLALGGSLTSSTRMTGDVDHANKAIPAIGPLIQWTLFDWGARRDVIDARDAALQAAVLAYRQSVFEAVGEAQSALAQLQRQQQRVVAQSLALDAATHGSESTRKLQTLGLADAGDSAAAELAAAQARFELAQARRDQALAFIALYKSFGGALPPLQADPAVAARK